VNGSTRDRIVSQLPQTDSSPREKNNYFAAIFLQISITVVIFAVSSTD